MSRSRKRRPTACGGAGTTAVVLAQDEHRAKLACAKRTYRARLKAGGASLKGVPVTDINALIGTLLDLHWLPEDQSEDRKALVAALGAMIDNLVASRSR